MHSGPTAITPPVKILAKLSENSVANWKNRIPIVFFAHSLRKIFDHIKSFHVATKTVRATVIIAGFAKGMIMRQKAPNSLQPSIFADSDNSFGIPKKNALKKRILKGKLIIENISIIPGCVLVKLTLENIKYTGTI